MTIALSVIIPVLDEAAAFRDLAAQLQPLRARGAQIVVVDGGSADGSLQAARACADIVLETPRGRASQMNEGAEHATGDVLVFLHADTQLPNDADRAIARALLDTNRVWGRFDVRIAPASPLLRVVAWSMNLRSRLTGIATGDQAMFVTREAFLAAGGFPDIPLMEDIALSKRLKRLGPPVCLREQVTTSARRWKKRGTARTILLMWSLRLAYFLGADPHWLAIRYGYAKRS